MRIAEVVGTVTLNSRHPSLNGAKFVIASPLSLAHLTGELQTPAEEIVVYDDLGASAGSKIAVSEGAEAAQPFRPNMKPIDAYNAAILDQIELIPMSQATDKRKTTKEK